MLGALIPSRTAGPLREEGQFQAVDYGNNVSKAILLDK